MVVSVLCLFLAVAWVGMWPVVVAFSSHSHILHVVNRHWSLRRCQKTRKRIHFCKNEKKNI